MFYLSTANSRVVFLLLFFSLHCSVFFRFTRGHRARGSASVIVFRAFAIYFYLTLLTAPLLCNVLFKRPSRIRDDETSATKQFFCV
uniref:Uncharacterized protein n=1 Tax=Ixodes ricinus TaxID=34613 RepID=A0A147BR70_IXORI